MTRYRLTHDIEVAGEPFINNERYMILERGDDIFLASEVDPLLSALAAQDDEIAGYQAKARLTAQLVEAAEQGEHVALIANRYGWNGVEISKILSVFIEDQLASLAERAQEIESLHAELEAKG